MPSPAVDQPQPPGASQHAWPSDRDLATLREDVAAFAELHGVPADPRDVRVAVAPYRVCPLGAHVDHQGGRVAGMALDCGVLLGFLQAPARKTGADRDEAHRNRNRNRTRVGASEVLLRSDAFAGEVARFDVTRPDDDIPGVFAEAAATDANDTETSRSVKEKEVGKSWEKYARGAACSRRRRAAFAARRRGRAASWASRGPSAGRAHGRRRAQLLRSDHCRVCHGTPARERTNGGGARAFEGGGARERFATDAARWRVARLARRAENERVGVRCGVLDQASIALAERDALTLIDCAGETHARIRLGADREGRSGFAAEPFSPRDREPPFKIMLAFSGLREALTSTGYNARVEECREAARRLLRAPGASDAVLGDVSPETHAREKTRPRAPRAPRRALLRRSQTRRRRGASLAPRRPARVRRARHRKRRLLCGELRVRVRARERAARDRVRDARRVRRAVQRRGVQGGVRRRARRHGGSRGGGEKCAGRRTRRRFRNSPATRASRSSERETAPGS